MDALIDGIWPEISAASPSTTSEFDPKIAIEMLVYGPEASAWLTANTLPACS